MAFQLFQKVDEGALNRVLITVIAEVAMVCATVLSLFAYFQLPITLSTASALVVFFAGSLFCWKSFATAQTILVLSVLVIEFILINYYDWLLAPFLLFDLFLILVLTKIWQPKDD